jgi:hypothetical protein
LAISGWPGGTSAANKIVAVTAPTRQRPDVPVIVTSNVRRVSWYDDPLPGG